MKTIEFSKEEIGMILYALFNTYKLTEVKEANELYTKIQGEQE